MNQKKVLIIDDEIDLCLLLKSYFLRRNYEVHLSHSLADGLKHIREQNPEVIFLDNNLPDGTGWTIAPEIAQDYPHTYINLISAYHPPVPKMPAGSRFSIYEKPITLADLTQRFGTISYPNQGQ
jgi:DNA-binding NtrC family response regulator